MAVRHGRVLQRHGDRTFALAISASIVAHALLLLAAPWWLDPSRKRLSAPTIVAHLVPLRPVPAPVPVVEARTEPRVEQERRPVRNSPPTPIARPVPSLPPVISAPVL